MSESRKLSQRRMRLSEKQRALLDKWVRGEFASPPSVSEVSQPIPRRLAQGPIPLSFAQQRLWVLDQLVPNSPVYNMAEFFRLTGPLDVKALEQSLTEIMRRHEILRTTIVVVEGQPVQIVVPPMQMKLPVRNLEALLMTEQDTAIRLLAAEEAFRPFNLSRDLPIRATLLRLHQHEHVLLLILHHIATDGWSISIITQELTALYTALSTGKPSPLPELPIQYADFAVWQRQSLQGEVLQAQLAYWKRVLADSPLMLELPNDHPRPMIQTFQGKEQSFKVSQELTESLKALGQREGATLFMVLMAAFQVLLFRYTGQSDIIVGTPVAGRTRTETENLIGLFVNTLVLRTNLSGNPHFLELLGRVREVSIEAFAHQDIPFDQIVNEMHLDRETSYNPLFQVMFVLQNTPQEKLELPGIKVDSLAIENKTAKFDLWLSIIEKSDGLIGTLEYNTDIFERSTIQRFANHFQILLSSIVSNSELSLSELPLLSADEKQQLFVGFNNTEAEYSLEKCLHQLIEDQVEQAPDAVAVTIEGEHLTYQELNQRANQLAHYLHGQGVGPEQRVGLCLERSLEMVIALLATLKVGAAYVPLDPSYPQQRLAFLLQDAQISLLLTLQYLLPCLPHPLTQPLLCLDTDWSLIRSQRRDNLLIPLSPDHLAYVIYTSGSTGQPKGVMVAHRGVCNRLLWMQHTYALTPNDRVLQKTPFSFDVSVWEFFWPLLTGARLVLARPEGHRDSAYLVACIGEQQITTLHFVPSLLRLFLEEEGLEQCGSLQRVICSGEALPFASQQRFFERLPAELHNLYGPTEASIDVSSWACQRDSERASVPIGFPIANMQLYVLDPCLEPVPVGVAGELYIGGIGLARGYLHQAKLTAEKFIPNPWTQTPGTRLYRTGDQVRWLANGAIEFLGRLDHQVKVRGVRIELGEIEAVLRGSGLVRDVVVVAQGETAADKRLVAYVVPHALQNYGGEEPPQEMQLSAERVTHWQQVFDETYSETPPQQESTCNVVGWESSYTDQPIAAEEMCEWIEYTVGRVLNQQPQHILEIGCGTGLLLFRIAPYCSLYLGTDISCTGLASIKRQLKREMAQVTLQQRSANDFAGLEKKTFDTVILNSVIQYFPSIDYLLQVVEGSLNLLKPEGRIFIGDVRSLPLLEAFHTSVEFYRAPSSMRIDHLKHCIQRRIIHENELIIDPAFFFALKQRFSQIKHVEIQLKRGHHFNELTRFRYDVILHVTQREPSRVSFPWLNWQSDHLSLPTVHQLLAESEPEVLGISGIPNARLSTENQVEELLASKSEYLQTVGDIRNCLQMLAPLASIDPEAIWAVRNDLPYDVEICWSSPDSHGSYDAVFRRRKSLQNQFPRQVDPLFALSMHDVQPWTSYANDPLQAQLMNWLMPALRDVLKDHLPEYMIPSAFVLVDHIPLLSNGKVDRGALLALGEGTMSEWEKDFVAPHTPVEQVLADIWSSVLGREPVSIHDNFFEIGGDSILSIQVVNKAHKHGFQFTPKQIFQHQTIAELARFLASTPVSQDKPTKGGNNEDSCGTGKGCQ